MIALLGGIIGPKVAAGVGRYWHFAAILGLVIALLLTRNTLSETKVTLSEERTAHRITVANYRLAHAKARLAMVENLKRVMAERSQIDERIVYVYREKRVATAVAGERLRSEAAAYLGNPGSAAVSAERESTCRAVAGTSCEAIPALLNAAQDNTDQLVALIAWAKAQGEVETNAP
ncbi:hypothetical protein [Sphingomonas sp.]|uniref:hypothetical protein n=1 Tax=Sphingomonas sp. TaxID=28214 RepID=UPI003F6F7A05